MYQSSPKYWKKGVQLIAHQSGRDMRCLLWVLSLRYVLPLSLSCCMQYYVIFNDVITRPDCTLYMTVALLVQDLSRLGRDLGQVVIIDNSPASYIFHPDNAVSTHALNNSNHIPINSNHIPNNSNHIPNAVSTCALNNSKHIAIDSMYSGQF